VTAPPAVAPPRLRAFDLLRGVGITVMVLMHTATFHYAGITRIDFDDPPLVILLIGFLLTWAGMFAVISGAAYAFAAGRRIEAGTITRAGLLRGFAIAAVYLLAWHFAYFVVLGPKLLDVEGGNHLMALLPGLIATGAWPTLAPERWFYATALSMIGWNALFVGVALWLGLGRTRDLQRVAPWLAVAGLLVMAASWWRIDLYPRAVAAMEAADPLPALFWGFLVNKNNPLLPYLAFGLLGAWLGLRLLRGVTARTLWPVAAVGALALAAGIGGLMSLPDTLLEREVDPFWYYLTVAQLGLFLLLATAALALWDRRRAAPVAAPAGADPLRPLRRIGTVSLTVFLLETPVSEVAARALSGAAPGWNEGIAACLAFGAVNAAAWVALANVWARVDYRYSVEWATVRLYRLVGRPTAKLPEGVGHTG
jgi:peptidoglycan/LPS O-acetylase OafA/YrhL